jgi:hypothetical protein
VVDRDLASEGKKKTKIKVTLSLDAKTWQEFQIHCITKYGRIKNASRLIQELIEQRLQGEQDRLFSDTAAKGLKSSE